jgi:hypothetical protein
MLAVGRMLKFALPYWLQVGLAHQATDLVVDIWTPQPKKSSRRREYAGSECSPEVAGIEG